MSTGETMSITDVSEGSHRYELFAAENEDATRTGVRELLTAKYERAILAQDHDTAVMCRKALHSRRRFNRLCRFVERKAMPEFLAKRAAGVITADGEFLKWLMVWLFEEGNWKKILEFILMLFA